jgi:NAD-dependent deacetylase
MIHLLYEAFDPLMQAAPHISPTGKIVILTGAGISKESGLDTFRDADGIWSKVRVEDVATPEAFARDPERVHAFYNMRRARHRHSTVAPNAAHEALARLEREWSGEVMIVTQNVDSLHERAGTTNLIHMHGVHTHARCNGCGHIVPWPGDMSTADICVGCGNPGGIRPHVVWFGETPLDLDRINGALAACDLFISIGTSGNVYPAANFVRLVRRLGQAHTVELNLEPSRGATAFAEAHYGPATQIVPDYVAALLGDA